MNKEERDKDLIEYYDLIDLVTNKFLKRNPLLRNQKDDLISEGTLGLINSIGTYRKDKGASKVTYYSKGIRNYIYNYSKRVYKRMRNEVYIDTIENLQTTPEEEDHVDQMFELYDELMPTDKIDRLVYVQNLTGGSSIQDIALELDMPYRSVWNRRARLLNKLKKVMEDSNEQRTDVG